MTDRLKNCGNNGCFTTSFTFVAPMVELGRSSYLFEAFLEQSLQSLESWQVLTLESSINELNYFSETKLDWFVRVTINFGKLIGALVVWTAFDDAHLIQDSLMFETCLLLMKVVYVTTDDSRNFQSIFEPFYLKASERVVSARYSTFLDCYL